MKKAIILLIVAFAAQLMAQDKVMITVKNSVTTNGVIVVTVLGTGEQAKEVMQLNCNKGTSSCTAPEPGTYLMVKLPKNWGMYDCANVDLYAASANPDSDQKIGEYCLEQK